MKSSAIITPGFLVFVFVLSLVLFGLRENRRIESRKIRAQQEQQQAAALDDALARAARFTP